MKEVFSFIFIFFIVFPFNTYTQGLSFNGSEHLIDERTSYEVFYNHSPSFQNNFRIGFELSLSTPTSSGYVCRIKDEKSNVAYNLSYQIENPFIIFKLNEEGRKNLITAQLKRKEFSVYEWSKILIAFDSEKKSLTLQLNDQIFSADKTAFPEKWNPNICFGRSDYFIDVPSFAIKNLSVSDIKTEYSFPLKESSGNVVHDSKGKSIGWVSNPVWLINDAFIWKAKQNFSSFDVAGSNFDTTEDKLYIFNKDSIIIYDLSTGDIAREATVNECPVEIFLGTNFLNYKEKKIYVYEVYYEQKSSKATVAVLDLNTKQWSEISYASLPMQLHHHSPSFIPEAERYYIFGGFGGSGGFGKMRYSEKLYAFDLNKNLWEEIKLNGDKINPRYFSSMGYQKKDNSLYIFGGMGNESGEQVVGRKYFYDLHKVDLNTNSSKRLWRISWNQENIVPVREMVIENDSCFYTLCYPEHFSETFLRLYQFSFKDGVYKILGDSIPIRSEKIKTKANLYLSSNKSHLYAIVQEFDNRDISSTIKVYSLSFPPISRDDLAQYRTVDKKLIILLCGVFLLLIIAVAIVIVVRKRYRRKKEHISELLTSTAGAEKKSILNIEQAPPKPNSIYLFGEFMVRDRANKDITYMFSSKLKQAFLTILQHDLLYEGISSVQLSELLWPDKASDKVKNSRGVTINHLRKILSELDGIELVHEKGMFRIVFEGQSYYYDTIRCLEIIGSNDIEKNLSELLEIVSRGKFLKSIDQPDFDSFKEYVEEKMEPALIVAIEKSFTKNDFQKTLMLCEALFRIDPINDEALYYIIQALIRLKMPDEAKKQYFIFINDYKKMMTAEYPRSFHELSNTRI